MKRAILILIAVLVVQVGLTFFTWSKGQKSEPVGQPLASFTMADIDHISLQDNTKAELVLLKKDGKWIMPEHFEAIADGNRIAAFLLEISQMKAGWPVATSDSAAKRFRVADDSFKVKVVLQKEGSRLMEFYLGDSAGVRSSYFRIKGSSDIYRSKLASYNFPTDPDKWLDKSILKQNIKDFTEIELNGMTFSRNKDGFILKGDEKSEIDSSAVRKLFSALANLTPDAILGTKEEPSYNLDKDTFRVLVSTEDGSSIEYHFGEQPEKENSYILKVSGREFYFRIPKNQVSGLLEINRETLIKKDKDEKTDTVD